jgi:hypothetical protein
MRPAAVVFQPGEADKRLAGIWRLKVSGGGYPPLGRKAPRDRGGAFVIGHRHCEERQRRSNPFFLLREGMDCFASLAMTVLATSGALWERIAAE